MPRPGPRTTPRYSPAQGVDPVYAKAVLLASLAMTSPAAPGSTTRPAAPSAALATQASPAPSQEQLQAALVEKLAAICAAHPEVERAFLLTKQEMDGSTAYMFVPIFDRKVSDQALNEADAAYRNLFASGGHLQLMLLARNTWKKSLSGVPPIYVRASTQK